MSIASEIAKMVEQPERGSTHRAQVLRTDNDGTTWVQIPGGADETILTGELVECSPGDEVEVTIKGGRATATGNATAPAVGERTVERIVAPVRERLGQAAEDADAAKLAAIAAQEAAEAASAANQHFWDDDNGAHVTEVEKDAWTDPTSPDYHSGHNMLLNSLGLLFRKAMNNLASFTQSAVAFFDGLGNDASNVVASFGADGFQAGKADESHLVGDYHSLRLVDKEGDTYFHVSDMRNEEGLAEITETFVGDGVNDSFGVSLYGSDMPDEVSVTVDGVAVSFQIIEWPDDILLASAPPAGSLVEITYQTDDERTKAYTLGKRKAGETMGGYSVAEGDEATASGVYSHAEGYDTAARGFYAHAEGWATASVNEAAHAEGVRTTASGTSSHAEGRGTTASGHESHAEGQSTTASGTWSHSEGYGTIASGGYSHAEGSDCVASGTCSHAQNSGTIAASYGQTAIGKCNVADANDTYALIVGNGTNDSNRSNAYTLDWDGNGEYAGHIQLSSGNGQLEFGTDQLIITIDPDGTERTQWGIMKSTSGNPYLRYRKYENGAWGSWQSAFVHAQASRTANTVLAAPNGSNGVATWRKLVPDDVSGLGVTVGGDHSSNVSVPNSTWKTIASADLTPGTWVLIGGVMFGSGSTGRRYVAISNADGSISAGYQRATQNTCPAISGASVYLHTSYIVTITAAHTYYLLGWQNNGGNLNCTGFLRAVRVG